MPNFDDKSVLEARLEDLRDWGHSSSVWRADVSPPQRGHVVEIVASYYVSRPCWESIFDAATFVDCVTVHLPGRAEHPDRAEAITIHQFFFSDIDIAKDMALKVQKSARNKRKEVVRQIRLANAGGFHDSQALRRLFEIQQGRCYYTGDQLLENPKNYAVDHIHPVYLGGTDWPGNLALAIKEVNTWKGGLASANDTFRWIAAQRGKEWSAAQKKYCLEVDKLRSAFDLEYRLKISQSG